MANRRPLALVAGRTQELPSGDLLPIDALASGSPDGTKFVRDDGVLATPPGSVQNFKEAAKYATTTALPTVVYDNGASGVGATLTGAAFGALAVDGAAPDVGDRVVVKDELDTTNNGIYVVTVTGSILVAFVLTRADDFDQSAELAAGDAVFVTGGATNTDALFVYAGATAPTMGADDIAFAEITAGGDKPQIIGDGLVLDGFNRIQLSRLAVTGRMTLLGSARLGIL